MILVNLQDFIKTRFRWINGEQVLKSRVVEVTKLEYDQQTTPVLVGRAMSKVFGAVFRNGLRKM